MAAGKRRCKFGQKMRQPVNNLPDKMLRPYVNSLQTSSSFMTAVNGLRVGRCDRHSLGCFPIAAP